MSGFAQRLAARSATASAASGPPAEWSDLLDLLSDPPVVPVQVGENPLDQGSAMVVVDPFVCRLNIDAPPEVTGGPSGPPGSPGSLGPREVPSISGSMVFCSEGTMGGPLINGDPIPCMPPPP